MTPAAHEAVPARGFNLEEEPVLCAPVQRSCWLRHPFLPKLIRKLLETPAIRKAAAHIVGNRDSRIEVSRHHESESEKIVEFRGPSSARSSPRHRETPECERQIEEVTEAFETMPHAVKAQKK